MSFARKITLRRLRQLQDWAMRSLAGVSPVRSRPRLRRRTTGVPDERLSQLWRELQSSFFPDRTDILAYRLVWSARPQRRTLASCNVTRHVVRVARELDSEQGAPYLAPVIYHEMCHAVLGKTGTVSGRNSWHGPQFKELESRHPDMVALKNWMKSGGWAQLVRRFRSAPKAVR